MTELFESSVALVAALIRIETPGGMACCRLCFQHGFPERDRVIEHLSTCPVGRVSAALTLYVGQKSGDILSPEKEPD